MKAKVLSALCGLALTFCLISLSPAAAEDNAPSGDDAVMMAPDAAPADTDTDDPPASTTDKPEGIELRDAEKLPIERVPTLDEDAAEAPEKDDNGMTDEERDAVDEAD